MGGGGFGKRAGTDRLHLCAHPTAQRRDGGVEPLIDEAAAPLRVPAAAASIFENPQSGTVAEGGADPAPLSEEEITAAASITP